jgi:hypothetical protein
VVDDSFLLSEEREVEGFEEEEEGEGEEAVLTRPARRFSNEVLPLPLPPMITVNWNGEAKEQTRREEKGRKGEGRRGEETERKKEEKGQTLPGGKTQEISLRIFFFPSFLVLLTNRER